MIRRVLKALRGRPRAVGAAGVSAVAFDGATSIEPGHRGADRRNGGGIPAIRVSNDREAVPQNSLIALAFDHEGYLWIGTEDGAARYDGRAWRVMPMPNRMESNHVRVIHSASDGSLWFGTHGSGVVILRDG